MEEEKFNQIFSVNYKLGEIIYLLGVMKPVYDKIIATEPLSSVL